MSPTTGTDDDDGVPTGPSHSDCGGPKSFNMMSPTAKTDKNDGLSMERNPTPANPVSPKGKSAIPKKGVTLNPQADSTSAGHGLQQPRSLLYASAKALSAVAEIIHKMETHSPKGEGDEEQALSQRDGKSGAVGIDHQGKGRSAPRSPLSLSGCSG